MTSKNMVIGLDYDGTVTSNIEFWLDFIKRSEEAGYRVCIVTMRYAHEKETMDPRVLKACPWVITTGRKAKRNFVSLFGVNIDIWIDDQPHFLLFDAKAPATFEHGDAGLFNAIDMMYFNPLQRKYVVIYSDPKAGDVLEKEFPPPVLRDTKTSFVDLKVFNVHNSGTILVQERHFSAIVNHLKWDKIHLLSTTALQPDTYELAMKHVPSAINTGITLVKHAAEDDSE